MTLKLSDRDVEQLLREPDRETRPPAELLARLRAELPAELIPSPLPVEPATLLRPPQWRRTLLSLAASLAVLVGGSLVAYRTFRQAAPPAATGAIHAAKKDVAAEVAAPREDTPPLSAAAPETAPLAPPPAKEKRAAAGGAAPPQRTSIPKTRAALPAAASPVAAEPKREGVAGGGVGGIAAPAPPLDEDAFAEGLAAPDPAARELAEGELAATAKQTENPPRLESPGIEANRQAAGAPAPLADERDGEDWRRRLESPTTQGDLGRARPAPPAAAPAARLQEISAVTAPPADPAWRSIERALAGGRWPSAEEIAAARSPSPPSAAADQPGSPSTRHRSAAAEVADPWVRLREQTLDFLAREEKSRSELAELRRRAVRLFEKNPGGEKGKALLRVLNLASGNLAD